MYLQNYCHCDISKWRGCAPRVYRQFRRRPPMQSFQRCLKSPWPPQAQRRKTLSLSAKVPRKMDTCFENIADDCRSFNLWVAKIAGVVVASIPGSHVFCLPSREVLDQIAWRKSRGRPITYHPDNPTCHHLQTVLGRPEVHGPCQVEIRLAHALITIPLFSAKTSVATGGIQSRQSLMPTPPSLQKTRIILVHHARPLRLPMEPILRPPPSVGSPGGCYRRRPRPLPVYGSSPVIA